ncbi:MAG: galactokinase [Anaerolineae bacterium]
MASSEDLHALLSPVYIHDDEYLTAQCARYSEAIEAFDRVYGPGPVRLYRAPGRVNLIGEHTDYNRGFVMPTAIDRDIVIVARPRADHLVRAVNVEGGRYEPFEFEVSLEIPSAGVSHWSNFVRGAAQRLSREVGQPLRGMDMVVGGRPPHGTPIGVGLSSSTSLTVVSALAFSDVNDMGLSHGKLAEAASQAEWYVGTRGGIMDQFASVFGRGGHALFLDCRPVAPGQYHLERIPLPGGYRLVVCSTGVRHENTRSEFNTRVFECRVGAHLLRRHFPDVRYLRDASAESLGFSRSEVEAMIAELLPEGIDGQTLIDTGVVDAVASDMPATFKIDAARDYRVRQRCRHVISENQRVQDCVGLLRAGDVEAFGAMMDAAHASARDDYEVSVPQVEEMVEAARTSAGCIGARITGAGWGGCVVAMVQDESVGEFVERVKERYYAATRIRSEVIVLNSATGAQVVSGDLSV